MFIFQVVAAYAMIGALNKKGYNGFSFVFPSLSELQIIFEIAAPVFITMVSKVYHCSSFTSEHILLFYIFFLLVHTIYVEANSYVF